MSNKRTFIGIAAVNQFGNWLTFLSVIVFAQQSYGSAASALIFLAQTVPALLAARSISDRIPVRYTRRAWILGQVTLAGITLGIAVTYHYFAAILAYVAISMMIRAVLNPLYMALLVESVPQPQRQSTMTGVGAAGSIAVVVSPAVGGLLLATVGPTYLFLLDAATFVAVSLWMLTAKGVQSPKSGNPPTNRWWSGLPSPRALARAPGLANRHVWGFPALTAWIFLLLVGALLNALETPFSFTIIQVSEAEFGWILACFGAGGLLVLIASLFSEVKLLRPNLAVVGYAVGLLVWMVLPTAGPYLGFFIAGLSAATLSGWVRASVDAWSQTNNVDAKLVWGWANQSTLFVNLVSYVLASVLFGLGLSPIYLAALLFLAFIPLAVSVHRQRPELADVWGMRRNAARARHRLSP
ncbi:MFS transporter [Cryobacterium sp. Y11]|uniref:MFS transporter n=1 Tax=Cryobacterium sp. Y11 TaxID=2045016 RepID=UPI001304AA8B|nr:MFS transporter [Cryobacterium sp. Y11]